MKSSDLNNYALLDFYLVFKMITKTIFFSLIVCWAYIWSFNLFISAGDMCTGLLLLLLPYFNNKQQIWRRYWTKVAVVQFCYWLEADIVPELACREGDKTWNNTQKIQLVDNWLGKGKIFHDGSCMIQGDIIIVLQFLSKCLWVCLCVCLLVCVSVCLFVCEICTYWDADTSKTRIKFVKQRKQSLTKSKNI